MAYQRKNFKTGDQVKFSNDYFTPDDLGMSGIVLGPRKNIYRTDVFTFLGYIEGDTSGCCCIFNKHKDIITVDGFLEIASND